ncbi:MAG: hypothetical protein GXY96_03490 [Tissierellia bacterium]|nr:hypothetical protein [Tissierellia bacterium]
MDMERIISEEIMAILPIYLKLKGNCSLLITKAGNRYEMERTVKSLLNLMGKFFFIDLKASRKYYGNLLNVKNLTPIPFNRENVFIPVKVRKPLCKNDGSFGYVNLNHIERTFKKEERTIIELMDGTAIESLSSLETVNKHIKNGHIVKKLAENRDNKMTIKEADPFDEYDKPATKKDIALLINEIIKIRENIR